MKRSITDQSNTILQSIYDIQKRGKNFCVFAGGGLSNNPFVGLLNKTPRGYWNALENLRVTSSYFQIQEKMDLFARFISITKPKTIVTSIYDAYIDRALGRYQINFILNPCIKRPDIQKIEDFEGYKNIFDSSINTRLYKIHGDVRYLRFQTCCRLMFNNTSIELEYSENELVHGIDKLKERWCHHVRIPEGGNALFYEEIIAAFEEMENENIELILSIGFSGDRDIDPHIVDFLIKLAKNKKSVIDINPSYTDLNVSLQSLGAHCFHVKSIAEPVFLNVFNIISSYNKFIL